VRRTPPEYLVGTDVPQIVRVLAAADAPAVMAGGVTLLPRVRRRMIEPDVVVDISAVDSLAQARQITADGGGPALELGAAVTQQAAARAAGLAGIPVLAQAFATMGTPVVRAQGTVVGALAQGDAALQLAALCGAFPATARLASVRGERTVPALSLFDRATRQPDELITAWTIRLPDPRTSAFLRVGRRHTGAHLAFVAVDIGLDPGGHCRQARIGVAVRGHDARPPQISELLAGALVDDRLLAKVATRAAAEIRVADDELASGGYRRHAVRVLIVRALRAAVRAQR
jgi:CO/xanthine dehydrogenase FAD-binding subunit